MTDNPRGLPGFPHGIPIFEAVTEQREMDFFVFHRTSPAIPGRHQYRETCLTLIPSYRDIRALPAVSQDIRQRTIALLWYDYIINAPWPHSGRIVLYLPFTDQPIVPTHTKSVSQELGDKLRDWSHTVIPNPSFEADYPRRHPEYLHTSKLILCLASGLHLSKGLHLEIELDNLNSTILVLPKILMPDSAASI